MMMRKGRILPYLSFLFAPTCPTLVSSYLPTDFTTSTRRRNKSTMTKIDKSPLNSRNNHLCGFTQHSSLLMRSDLYMDINIGLGMRYSPFIARIDKRLSTTKLSSSSSSDLYSTHSDEGERPSTQLKFRRGNPILVEVTRFGPLGASVDVISSSHNSDDIIALSDPPLGVGLILQSEISYFRSSRNGLDVVLGEIIPAYVNWVRDDHKIDVTIRKPGGRGKAEDLSKIILQKIQDSKDGKLCVGDKSSPEEINKVIPGSSKAQFKRAVALLYKKGLVKPGADSTTLM